MALIAGPVKGFAQTEQASLHCGGRSTLCQPMGT